MTIKLGIINPETDLQFTGGSEERAEQIAYYLEQLAEELPTAMRNAGGENLHILYDLAAKIGKIAEDEMIIANGL
jgi:hypothetical protein